MKKIKHKTVKKFANKHNLKIIQVKYDKLYTGYDLYNEKGKKIINLIPMFNHEGTKYWCMVKHNEDYSLEFKYSFKLKNLL
jgi:hypothetical protein